MAERGRVWTDDETRCLLAIWSEDAIQRELNGSYRKDPVWKKIAQELKRQNSNFDRSSTQCSTKVKQLKQQYKEEVDKLRKSGVGLESEDEDDVFVSFKWFFEMHQIMRNRAVVSPPALLESSTVSSATSRSSTPTTDLHAEETDSVGQTSNELSTTETPSPVPAAATPSPVPAAATPSPVPAATTPSSVPAATTPSSVPAATTPSAVPAATTSSPAAAKTTTTSTSSSSVGPSRKKRKLTKLEQADKTTVKMFETMMKANKEFEDRQERLQEVRLQKQDEQLKAQQDILKRQEEREERLLNFMQQMMMMVMPAAGTQMAGPSMYAMPPPPPTHPLHPTEVPFPGYPTYPAQDSNMPDNESDD